MSRAFARLAFTPAVQAAQERHGSRTGYAKLERGPAEAESFGAREIDFIKARDSFIQATVSETGWPYVQHRGGPIGFLRVLDPHTLAYADFRGNLQYLSVGNLAANDRVMLFLIDQAEQRRLKVWGRARVVEAADDPALLRSLAMPGYPARIERAIVITLEAFDWNCPQHITPRFTDAEIARVVEPLERENAALRARLAALGALPAG